MVISTDSNILKLFRCVFLDRCSDGEDFKALTITMLSTVPYLREELLLEYEALIDELLRNGILTKNHTSIIIKGVLLLNNIYHKPSARQMVYRLLQMLNIQLNKLFIPHLLDLHRVSGLNSSLTLVTGNSGIFILCKLFVVWIVLGGKGRYSQFVISTLNATVIWCLTAFS